MLNDKCKMLNEGHALKRCYRIVHFAFYIFHRINSSTSQPITDHRHCGYEKQSLLTDLMPERPPVVQ